MSPEVGKRNSKMLDVPVRDSSAGSVSPKLSRDESQCVKIGCVLLCLYPTIVET